MRPYTDDPVLNLYVFEESYVLGFGPTVEGFVFDLDVAPSSDNPDWHPPPPGDAVTYWRARLVFTHCSDLTFESFGVRPSTDADGEVDYGTIDSFMLDGAGCRLDGDWGRLTMTSGTVDVVITDRASGSGNNGSPGHRGDP